LSYIADKGGISMAESALDVCVAVCLPRGVSSVLNVCAKMARTTESYDRLRRVPIEVVFLPLTFVVT
jgi:hypothetical protein